MSKKQLTPAEFEKLVTIFYQAAKFLQHHVEVDGWTWSSNSLREIARCQSGKGFGNDHSPDILRELRKRHPELAKFIRVKKTKGTK